MKYYTIREEYLTLWTNDTAVTTETVINSDKVSRLAHEWGKDENELIEEQLIETSPAWYAVGIDEDDNDWGTGSFDYTEAVAMARRMDAKYIAVIRLGDDPICERVIDLTEEDE